MRIFFRKYWPLIALIMAVASVIWLVAFPVGNECERYNKNGQHQAFNECIQDASAESVAEYTKVLAALTIILAVVGTLQMFYVVRADDNAAETAKAARKSAEVAERTLFYANRAYIDVSKMYNEWNRAVHPKTGEIRRLLKYRIGITNRGNTPALKFNLSVGTWESLVAPTEATFAGLDKNTGSGTVSPDTEVLSADFFIQEEDIRNIHVGKQKYWLFIHVAYRDVFDNTPVHEFQTCRELTFIADPEIAWARAGTTEETPDIIRWIPDDTFTKNS